MDFLESRVFKHKEVSKPKTSKSNKKQVVVSTTNFIFTEQIFFILLHRGLARGKPFRWPHFRQNILLQETKRWPALNLRQKWAGTRGHWAWINTGPQGKHISWWSFRVTWDALYTPRSKTWTSWLLPAPTAPSSYGSPETLKQTIPSRPLSVTPAQS